MSSTVFARMCGFAATAFLGAALAQADVQPTRILCYGDSTTWGQVGNDGFASGQSYPCCLQKILGDKYDVKNISLGGSCVLDMLVWRGVRELRTKPYYSLGNKSVLNDIVLKKDGSFTGIAFTGGSNPFCFVSTGSDDVGLKYKGYPVYGQCTEAAGLFWPSHDGAAFTQAEATQIGLTGNRSGQRAWSDYGEHRAQGIGRCRCYYNPNDASEYVDVEIRYSSSLFAAMRLLESRDADVTIPCGSKIVPIDTTETWKSDLHIIMFGLNDSGFCQNNYWTLIKEATDRIVADGGRYLVLMSHSACASRIADTKMKQYFGDRYLDLYAKFTEKDENGDYKSFAYAENLGYTNVRTTELQQYAKIPITFATDKYHPLPIAYDLMAHWVYDKLVALGELEGDEPEPGVAAVPVAATGLTYSGKAQTGVAARTGCTVTGGEATDAGDYEATATLADGYEKWADNTTAPKKISWSIAKGTNKWTTKPSVSPATWVEDGVPAAITIANGATAFGAAVTCDTTEAALKALGEGDHTVTFTAAAGGDNYDAITKTVTVTVTAGEVPGPGPTPGPTPVEGLPEGYTAAAAVTSVNGDSVWFDTNHKPTSDTVSQIKFTFTKDGGAGLYGYLSPSADDGTDYRLAATGGKWMLDLGDNKKRIGPYGPAAACGTATANVENWLEIGNYYIKDLAADETLASVTPVTFSRDYTLRIFGKQAGYAAYGSVVSLKIFEKGTLVHDFVPCVSPEGVTGLFDLCTSYFHKPDGTFAKVEGGDEPALTPVAAPVAATGLAYTGKLQTGVAAATGYTVTGGAATDAGDYTATATLADGYKWSDGTTEPKKIAWSIAKGVNTWTTNPSVSPATWSVDAVPETVAIANGATAFGATVTCDTTVAALKALGEGDHTVTFTAAGGKNYDAITKTVTVTVTAGETPEPTEHRDPDTAAVTYTWRNVAGGDWDLASNWSASVDPCYGSPSNATYATAVFPATLVSPLTVTGMGAFPVKQITFGNAAELTLKGMSVTQGNTSGNNISESGVAVTLDGPDTVANFGSFVIGNVSDVRYTVRGGAKHVNTTGRVRYGATSSNVVVRAEGAGTLVDFRSNTAQTPNAYGSDHRWEAVDGAKLYNGANQFIFSDDTRFSQVRPTIRVDNGTVSATTEFRYGTRADAVSPRLEFAGEKPEFTVLGGNKTKSTRITLGTHPEMTGVVTLSYVLPAAGWSVAPFRATGLGAGGEAYAEIGAKAAFDIDATALGVPAAGAAVTNALMSADAIAVDDPSVLAGAVIRCATGAVGELALSDDGKTLNLVVTASGTPGPQKDPVIPGGEPKTYPTEAAAKAAAPEKVTPPEDVAEVLAKNQEALASYLACFTVATRQNAAGQWVNVAELKPKVEAELQLQVDGGAAKVVDALADVSLTSVTLEPVTPGFRYAFEYGETLGAMASQDSVIATEARLTLPLPKNAGATSGFYRVVVRETK